MHGGEQTPAEGARASTSAPATRGRVLRRKCACGKNTAGSGECGRCADKEKRLQRRAARANEDAGAQEEVPQVVHDVLGSPGHALDAGVRSFMESRFGHDFSRVRAQTVPARDAAAGLRVGPPDDRFEQEAEQVARRVTAHAPARSHAADAPGYDFSQVRIHTDARAAQSARAVNALAYTAGRDIVFGEGQYRPHTADGLSVLAHELTHTLQQQSVSLLRRQVAPAKTCTTTFTKAGNFRQLVDLVRAAEAKLVACGKTDIGDRINMLRGIYYGTEWSADFKKEKSEVRNQGFQTFTGTVFAPDDPRACLDCNLFEALQASQDVTDGSAKGARHVDVGHLLIGMDARRSWAARKVSMSPGGASGLAISTWVGDLGGGAALLAKGRVAVPTKPATDMFVGSNFGGSINLEGDVAGYDVGRDASSPTDPAAPVIASGKGIADALESYLIPAGAGSEWNNRCGNFLRMVGGTVSGATLTNRAAVVSALAPQVEGFACFYLWNRLRQQEKLSSATMTAASEHITGASKEVTEVFVDALAGCMAKPAARLAPVTKPSPSPKGSVSPYCQSFITGTKTFEQGKEKLKEVEEGARRWFGL
jgi:hypothetical protein